MFSHLAVGLDGSLTAAAALDLSLDLSRRLGSVLHGVHVMDVAMLEGSFIADVTGALGVEPLVNLTGHVERALTDLADTIRSNLEDRAAEEGVAVEFHLARGSVAPSLVDATRSCSLLVVGARGVNDRYHGDLLGPVCERLLRLSRVPILVVTEASAPVSHLLIAYDGSAKADLALRWGGDLAIALGLPVTVATAQSNAAQAEPVLGRAAAHLEPLDLTWSTVWQNGPAAEVIEEVRAAAGADLVCMGAHGRSRLVEMVLGSTAEGVLRRTRTPVLCVG
jgi:nucleotide-binding universal stress UspA family protein